MICDVCGRDNAEHLKFCADCGKKFSVVAPAPAPPVAAPVPAVPAMPAAGTPAAGMPATPASGTSRVSSPGLDGGSGRRSHRPEAPAFNFAPTPQEKEGHCPTCGTVNPPAFRFCAVCGTTIPARPAAAKAPTPIEDAKLVPAPVLSISDVQEAKPEIITCARCRGQCVKGARFCKYCGAALTGETPSAAPPQRVEGLVPPARDPAAEARAADAPAVAPAPGPAPAPQAEPARVVTASPTFVARKPDEPPPAPVEARAPAPEPAPAAAAPAPVTSSERRVLGKLVVLVEDGSEGKTYELSDAQVDIGRADGDILLFDDAYVSPRHARLIFTDGAWVVRDLGSVNGVYARIRGRYALQDGDLILLGLQVLQFQAVPESEQKVGFAVQHGTRVFGSKPVTRLARLVQRTTEGLGGDVYHLFRDETVVGREVGDIVFTHDPFLSRKHASVRFDASSVTAARRSGFVLEDLGSSNGTYIAIRNDHPLQHGDRIRVGQHLFRLDVPGDATSQTKGSDR